jgi:hypothetical protein
MAAVIREALPVTWDLDWLHAASINPLAMPAAMKPRRVSRALPKGPPLVGSSGIDRSSSSVKPSSAPHTVLGWFIPGTTAFVSMYAACSSAFTLPPNCSQVSSAEGYDDERDQGVVHQDVHPAPALSDFVGHGGDVIAHGDIGPNRDGIAAGRSDAGNHLLGLRGAGAVVDHDRNPRSARTLAVAAPIPRLAPVIIATRGISR